MEITAKRQIKRIVFLFLAAITCAVLLTLFMLHYYGPTGRYLAGDTILSPATLTEIQIRDKHPQTGQNVRFIFDKTEFSYFDPKIGQSQSTISFENYEQFYRLVASEKSLEIRKQEIEKLFDQVRPTILTTTLRTDVASTNINTKIFQIIQFVEEGYFRVKLHGSQEREWVYFYYPNLYRTIMSLFMSKSL